MLVMGTLFGHRSLRLAWNPKLVDRSSGSGLYRRSTMFTQCPTPMVCAPAISILSDVIQQ